MIFLYDTGLAFIIGNKDIIQVAVWEKGVNEWTWGFSLTPHHQQGHEEMGPWFKVSSEWQKKWAIFVREK